MKRRELISSALLLSTSVPFSPARAATAATDTGWWMPDETQPRTRTWMAFGI